MAPSTGVVHVVFVLALPGGIVTQIDIESIEHLDFAPVIPCEATYHDVDECQEKAKWIGSKNCCSATRFLCDGHKEYVIWWYASQPPDETVYCNDCFKVELGKDAKRFFTPLS